MNFAPSAWKETGFSVTKVVTIGEYFVCGDSTYSSVPIKTIDLSAFTLVTEIESRFINYTSIVNIDLSSLRNVVKTGRCLLLGNAQLQTLVTLT